MRIEVDLSELEELILQAVAKRSKTAYQVMYYLEGKGVDMNSRKIAVQLRAMERMKLVTRVKTGKVYRYSLNIELEDTDDD